MATWDAFKRQLTAKAAGRTPEGPKYKRRGDAEAERVKRYLEEQEEDRKRQEERRLRRLEGLRDVRRQTAAVEVAPSPAPPPTGALPPEEATAEDSLTVQEVIKRLRLIAEPVTLFGETDRDRWLRLRQLQWTGDYDMLVEQGRNDFADQLRRSEEETSRREAEEHQEPEEDRRQREAQAMEELEQQLQGISDKLPDATGAEYVALCFRKCLKAWELLLLRRPAAEKASVQGRHAHGFFGQTQAFLRPLFEALEGRSLAPAILTPLGTICELMEQREYVRANEWYMRLAIGNAAWPMGVTNVGIHERAAEEAIFCGKVAHILNNEMQRKYIQGVKRLLTQAQTLFPTDPSKSVW